MTIENSTENVSTDINTVAAKPGAFFDPSWQLAVAVEYGFQYAVLVIGVVGTAANALVMYALIAHNARETKKRAINLLIIHQNLLDLVCCVLLLTSVCIQIASSSIYLTGVGGFLICVIFLYDTGTYCALYSSIINLLFVTMERYLKVVHPFWSKKNLKRWMIYAAMAFAWAGGIASASIPVALMSFRLEEGFCSLATFEEELIYGSFNLVIFFLCPLAIFVYCYGRMVVVMRRQMRALAGHGVEGPSNSSQPQSKRIK